MFLKCLGAPQCHFTKPIQRRRRCLVSSQEVDEIPPPSQGFREDLEPLRRSKEELLTQSTVCMVVPPCRFPLFSLVIPPAVLAVFDPESLSSKRLRIRGMIRRKVSMGGGGSLEVGKSDTNGMLVGHHRCQQKRQL